MKSLNLLVYLKFLIFDLEKRYIQKTFCLVENLLIL